MRHTWVMVLVMVFFSGGVAGGTPFSTLDSSDPTIIETGLRARLLSRPHGVPGIEALALGHRGRTVRLVRGRLSGPLAGDSRQAIIRFLNQHPDLAPCLATPNRAELQPIRHHVDAGREHWWLQPVLDGIPVHGQEIGVHLERDRTVSLVTNTSEPLMRPRHGHTITADHARAMARSHLRALHLRRLPAAAKVWFPQNDELRPAWLVELAVASPFGDFDVVVDAVTGTILTVTDELQSLRMNTGSGRVFPFNPMHGPPVTVDLPYLTGTTPSGPFVRVENAEGPLAQNPQLQFHFEPTNPFFDQINVYYHLNRMREFLRGLGFAAIDQPIRAVVRFKERPDAAFFSSRDNMVAFGAGVKLNNLAHEESVIYHEYAHAALSRIIRLTQSGEAGALNEGQADYFACTLTGDPIIGEWVKGKTGNYLRKIDNKLHYPEALVYQVHADGRIWGGALWDIRKELGPKIADLLIHKSLFYLHRDVTFYDGFQALLAADRAVFNGLYNTTLMTVFQRRGIAKIRPDSLVLDRRDLSMLATFDLLHDGPQPQGDDIRGKQGAEAQ
jgi:hypothetical protein